MDCIRCSGDGIVFAYSKEYRGSAYVFNCGCKNWKPLPSVPSWENFYDRDYIPEYRKQAVKDLFERLYERDKHLHRLFSEGNWESELFKEAKRFLGEEFVRESFRVWRDKKNEAQHD